MGIYPQLANVDLAVYGDLAIGRVLILNNPRALPYYHNSRLSSLTYQLDCVCEA